MLLQLVLASLLSAGATAPPASTLCGIELSRPSLELLHDVERRLGKTIRCETHLEYGTLGASDVAADGTPEIVLDRYEGRTEENVVHELFHLQLRAKGFPQRFKVKAVRTSNPEFVQSVAEQLASLIEHRLYYPQMRQMGFDPTLQYRQALETWMSQDKLYGASVAAKRTVNYAEVSLLIQDPALTRRVEAWYGRRGWNGQLSRGKKLARYLATFNPDTPEKKGKAVPACLEIVFGRKIAVTWVP